MKLLNKTARLYSQKKIYMPFILISFLIILLWISSGYFLSKIPDAAFRGTIGDIFNPISSLFSGLAFCGVICTIYLQSKEVYC